jgi:hypothetical protein
VHRLRQPSRVGEPEAARRLVGDEDRTLDRPHLLGLDDAERTALPRRLADQVPPQALRVGQPQAP